MVKRGREGAEPATEGSRKESSTMEDLPKNVVEKKPKKQKQKPSKSVNGTTEISPVADSAVEESAPLSGLQIYWQLAAADEKLRETAADALLTELRPQQAAYEQEGFQGDGVMVSDASGGKNNLPGCSSGLQYAVPRLIRGLASSRQGARQGFALALTGLLREYPAIPIKGFLQLVDQELELPKGLKGPDARDALLGRVFAYGALARSGRLSGHMLGGRLPAEAKRTEHKDERLAMVRDVAQELMDLAGKKNFAREAATAVILQLADNLAPGEVEISILTAPLVVEALTADAASATPEALLLALKLWSNLPQEVLKGCQILPPKRTPNSLFSRGHLQRLVPVLKAASHSHPRVHPVWYALLNHLVPPPGTSAVEDLTGKVQKKTKKKKAAGKDGVEAHEESASATCGEKELATFVSIVVDGGLLPSSHERRHLALQVVQLLLQQLQGTGAKGSLGMEAGAKSVASGKLPAGKASQGMGVEAAPAVLSGPLIRCLLDSLVAKDAHLHATSQHCLSWLEQWAAGAANSVPRVALVAALQQHSRGRFDELTRTATVKRLAAGLDSAGAASYLEFLQRTFLEGAPSAATLATGDESVDTRGAGADLTDVRANGVVESYSAASAGEDLTLEERRRWAVESMCSLPRHHRLAQSVRSQLQETVLKFLLVQALYVLTPGGNVTPPIQEPALRAVPSSPLSEATRATCRVRFLALLAQAVQTVNQKPLPAGAKEISSGENKGKKRKATSQEAQDVEEHDQQAEGAWKLLERLAELTSQVASAPAELPFAAPMSNADGRAARQLRAAMKAIFSAIEAHGPGGASKELQRLQAMHSLQGVVLLQCLLEPGSTTDAAAELAALTPRTFQNIEVSMSEEVEEEEEGTVAAEGEADPESRDSGDPPNIIEVLVDVLLSLLAQPSLPVKIAGQTAFAAFCSDLTETALADMLRVVSQQPDPRRRKMDEEDEQEGTDENDEEEVVGQDGDDDVSDDVSEVSASSDDEDDEPAGPKERASEQDEGAEEGSEEAEEDLMNDEAMFRIDRYLEEVLKQRKASEAGGAGKSSRAKAERLQLQHFQLRVLSLLETYLRKCPGDPLVLKAVPSMLSAFSKATAGADGGSSAVGEKIASLLLGRVCKAKEYPKGPAVSAQAIQDVLLSSLELAVRAPKHQVAAVAASCSLWATKLLQVEGGPQKLPSSEILKAFSDTLGAAFTHKKSHLPRRFFYDAMGRHPWLGPHLFPTFLQYAKTGRSHFVRLEALQLAQTLLQKPPQGVDLGAALRPHLQTLGSLLAALPCEKFGRPQQKLAALRFCQVAFQSLAKLYPVTPLADLVDTSAIGLSLSAVQEELEAGSNKKTAAVLASISSAVENASKAPGLHEKKLKSGQKTGGKFQPGEMKKPNQKMAAAKQEHQPRSLDLNVPSGNSKAATETSPLKKLRKNTPQKSVEGSQMKVPVQANGYPRKKGKQGGGMAK